MCQLGDLRVDAPRSLVHQPTHHGSARKPEPRISAAVRDSLTALSFRSVFQIAARSAQTQRSRPHWQSRPDPHGGSGLGA